ncbi:type II toxin-antitoxin system RatA family toxin [Pinibacter aurantiacus]|uniref:SRPBCC family protein n=1 Tax=Pinibacter aurantiacus TaxID=2851599 RepID=A0A9E2S8B7_9BACT|nr:SRPBCC family protein [Pinibacter aurantiacus]MBV4357462.1 SRPBCC family protein [Pinibacter aurantiacus]
MEQIKFTETILINEKVDAVFDYTQDYNSRLNWDTFLKKAELIEGAKQAGKGVKAHCVAKNGLGMVTEYVTYNRPRVTAIKMTKGPYLFKSFFGSWTFKQVANDTTEVIFLYSFTLRFPFNLLTNFITTNLQTNVKQRLIDLKNKLENESINA